MKIEDFDCEFIPQSDIDEIANEVRENYWEKVTIPVDVELVIERIGLDIIPKPLPENIDAYLKIDGTGIVVNQVEYYNDTYKNRLRFSIAHEPGHFILHKDIIAKMVFQSIEEYKTFFQSIPEDTYSYFEYQANEFAGRLLVPFPELKVELLKTIKQLDGINFQNQFYHDREQLLAGISPFICEPFCVSSQVIERRVQREGLLIPEIFLGNSIYLRKCK